MSRGYIRELVALFCACVFVAGAFIAGRTVGADRAVPCTADAGYPCWEMYYNDRIARDGSVVALNDLQERYERGESAKTFCHPLLHLIGGAAGREFGSVAAAYEYGETFCRSGYHHGVLEGIFGDEGGDRLVAGLDSICIGVEGRERYSYDYFSCVHGIGHGLMAYFDHDLFASLGACDTLTSDWEQTSCHGGVFMENVISDSPEMPSRYLRTDDPIYPCNAVEERHREQCYMMQTSHVLALFGNDFGKVFDVCSRVEEAYRTQCFQSIGRDVSGFAGNSVEVAISTCAMSTSPDAAVNCFIGASVDFLQTNGEAAARAVCDGAGESHEMCTRALDEQIRML